MFNPIYASASEIARAIREKRISAVETLEAHLARIARLNGAITAVILIDEEGARHRAQEADEALARGEIWGPLHGVPMTITDLVRAAGMRTTLAGNPEYADYVPTVDSTLVARLRKAGAVFMGKSNDDHNFWGEKGLFPLPKNPWDVDRVLSGCGGTISAVAAGFTPLEVGGDSGSTQWPAHYTGVYALRPTEHRIPGGEMVFTNPVNTGRTTGAVAPVARSVEDLRLALEILAGPNGVDTDVPPVPLGEYSARELSDLRIAWTPRFPGTVMDDEIAASIEAFAAKLRQGGATTVQTHPELDFRAMSDVFMEVFNMQIEAGNEIKENKPGPSLGAYFSALQRKDELWGVWDRFMADWDVFVAPVATFVAPFRGLNYRIVNGVTLTHEERVYAGMPSQVAPVTGLPIVVMPLGRNHEGMPFGIQVVGHRWKEMDLLAVAEKVAAMAGGFVRPPGF